MDKSGMKQAGCKTSLPVAQLRRSGLEASKNDLKEAFQTCDSFSTNDKSIVLHCEPFLCCSLSDFIVDDDQTAGFIQSLKDELLNLQFFEKSNDLYKFHQSNDLKKVNTPYIASLRSLLYGEFREWIQDICGLKLNETVDMSCARYDYTDVLLCHDDQLEGRRIAYIYYLVPPWEPKDGGALQLFNCDENNEPSTVAKSIYPEWNSFVFFPVSPKSFHQVSEVLTEDKTRLSISGWFYGDPIEYPCLATRQVPTNLMSPMMLDEEILGEWLNPKYFDHWSMLDIRHQKFEKDSEVMLLDFLKEDKFKVVSDALKEIEWTTQGPPNKRNIETADTNSALPEVVQTFLDILHSDAMFYMLSTATGLKLHELASEEESSEDERGSSSSSSSSYGEPKSKTSKMEANKKKAKNNTSSVNPKCNTEIRRFKHGSYTLLHDRDVDNSEYSLDAIMFFNCEGWQSECGGFISYVAKDEDEELLTVNPEANALALVYRDKETLRFVKHLNHRSRKSEFHAIWSKFYK